VTHASEQPLPLLDAGKPASAPAPGPAATAISWRRATAFAAATFVLGVVLGGNLGTVIQRSAAPSAAPPENVAGATAQQATLVGALGRLMPEDDTTTLALPFASGDARVAQLLVREGQCVASGQVVAELDNLPQRMAQRAKAVAELAAKRAALDQARSAARLSLAEAHAGDDRARAARRAADQQLVRIQELANVGMATRVQLDQTQSTAAQAAADQARATATIQRYAGHDSDTQPDVRLAIRELEVATAALAQADQELAGARVTATLDGTVIAIHVRVGEKPGDRGIATLGNTDRMAAELEVYQTDIRKVALGQPVVLSATSLDAPLAGTVSRIGLEVKRQALLAADPAANTDARIVKIRVSLDKPSSERSRMLTGLQVIGKIAAGRS
jgi:HlyD family secretion protein